MGWGVQGGWLERGSQWSHQLPVSEFLSWYHHTSVFTSFYFYSSDLGTSIHSYWEPVLSGFLHSFSSLALIPMPSYWILSLGI